MHFSHVSETGRERAAGDVSASTSPLFKTRRSHGHGQLVGGLWTGVGPKGGPQLGDVAAIWLGERSLHKYRWRQLRARERLGDFWLVQGKSFWSLM